MDQSQLSWLTNFIWNIADDVLRDVYVRGKYRDVILALEQETEGLLSEITQGVTA